jgi:hypothetical protein
MLINLFVIEAHRGRLLLRLRLLRPVRHALVAVHRRRDVLLRLLALVGAPDSKHK